MMHRFVKRFKIDLLVLYFLMPLLLDRVTKYFVVTGLWQSQKINSFFNLYVTYNRGIALGFASNFEQEYLVLLTILIAGILSYFAWYTRLVSAHRGMFISSLLVLSGGVSNFIDRIFFEGVVDFMQFHVGSYYFPVFNVADVFITCGAFLLSYFFLSDDKK